MRILVFVGAIAIVSVPRGVRACGPGDPEPVRGESMRAHIVAIMTHPELPLARGGDHERLLTGLRLHGKTFSRAEADAIAEGLFERDGSTSVATNDVSDPLAARLWNAFAPTRTDPENYQTYVVCGDDMLHTALATLAERRGQYSEAELTDWVAAQEHVFQSCSDPEAQPPAQVVGDAPTLTQQDRAYQIAQALTNRARTLVRAFPPAQGGFAGESGVDPARAALAEAALTAIVDDRASPWRDLAVYRRAHLHFLSSRLTQAELDQAVADVHDVKAIRGLAQLRDRLLYRENAAQAFDALWTRLLTTDVGADAARVVSDCLWLWHHRLAEGERAARQDRMRQTPCASAYYEDECVGTDEHPSGITALRTVYWQAVRLVRAERDRDVRALLAEHRAAIDRSTPSTQNEFDRLRGWMERDPVRAFTWFLLRTSDSNSGTYVVDSDGGERLRNMSQSQWLRVLRSAEPRVANMDAHIRSAIQYEGTLRALLAGDRAEVEAFGMLTPSTDADWQLSTLLALLRTRAVTGQVYADLYTLAPLRPVTHRPEPNNLVALFELLLARAEGPTPSPHLPELLHIAIARIARHGGLTSWSRRAFRVLHRNYSGNEWMLRTPYYY